MTTNSVPDKQYFFGTGVAHSCGRGSVVRHLSSGKEDMTMTRWVGGALGLLAILGVWAPSVEAQGGALSPVADPVFFQPDIGRIGNYQVYFSF